MRHVLESDYVLKGELKNRNGIDHEFIVQPGLHPTVAILPVIRKRYDSISYLKIFGKTKKN